MATVYWRGKSAYLNWSQGGVQRRESLGRITPHEAEIRRQAKELELSTGKRLFIASALFDAHLERYLTWHRTEFPDSHFRVAQIAEQHFGDFRGRALSQINQHDIEAWKVARLGSVSRGTVAKELRTLKAILSKAVEWREIERNPAEYVDAPRNLESEPIHWYTKAELAKLYKRHNGQVWRLMANTGLRRTEALQLRWEHVDLKRGMLTVVSTQGARTKSGRWRQIPLSDAAKEALRKLKRLSSGDHVLPRVMAESLSRNFADNARSLKLRGSLHSLRHTYGAHLVMAGVPLRTVQVLMGHASFVTTERYAHVGKEHLRQKARLVSL